MFDADPQGLQDCQPCNRRKKRNGKFAASGVNWVRSLARHDKFMRFQSWTFQLAVYGCYYTALRKVLFIKV